MVETTSCPANASSLPSSGVDHVPTSWVGSFIPLTLTLTPRPYKFWSLSLYSFVETCRKVKKLEKVLCFWSNRIRFRVELCCSARIHKHLCHDQTFIVTSHSATQNPNILLHSIFHICGTFQLLPTIANVYCTISFCLPLQLSRVVTHCLDQHRKSDCKYGRITCSEDFKYLARRVR